MISYDVLPKHNVTCLHCSDTFRQEEMEPIFDALTAEVDVRLPHRIMMDFRDVSRFDISFRDIAHMSHRLCDLFADGNAPAHVAICAGEEAQRQFGRLFIMICKDDPRMEMSLHPDPENALRTLGIAPPIAETLCTCGIV